MEKTGEDQILETDPECRTLRTKEGLLPAYNIQAVVDGKNHIIASFETTVANTCLLYTSRGESERRNRP